MTPNTLAALFMMGSMAAFTLNDTCVKVVGGDLPLFQIVTLRGAVASVLIYIAARHLRLLWLDLPRRDWVLIAVRSAAEASATYFFLTALMHMPLANVTAVIQALPLTVTLGAALFLGEPVGWRRMTAIGIGLAGVLLIVRPGPEGFSLHAIYALAAVFCVTLRDLVTRRMSGAVPSMTVTLAASLSVTLFGAVASVGTEWVPLDLRTGTLVFGAAFFIIGGYLFSILVMRVGEVSASAPFRYTGLLWALALGWLVFGHWPEPLTLLGAGIVVGSGLFTLYRERAVPNTRRT